MSKSNNLRSVKRRNWFLGERIVQTFKSGRKVYFGRLRKITIQE